jgi:predicted NAD/FAD-binding protein
MSAAAVLREAEDFDDAILIAVVDAAARWLDEPAGDEYAWALLGALTDSVTQQRAYGELLGAGGAR